MLIHRDCQKQGLLTKSPNGKKWIISQKGEEEFGA